ncbi:MAG: prolipoprotein diacylglyceryl transferase [Sulfurospirillaceae bacterium]|nr:prolipoprotein diacylglyceryl transferase [Sulfurospirillaceae bacterium]MCK9545681.1 prolipoprotein diacylglyceryl transferase [Sulfurospirillaceae bacterium]
MSSWNYIYTHFNPVAFNLGPLAVHWYGIMYALALISALYIAKFFSKRYFKSILPKTLDSYFLWVEIGVILGARIGYIIFYDPNALYYFTNPWQIFNPFANGVFVGIRGMSFHGALIGFLIATWGFSKKHKKNPWLFLDLVALSVPLAYVFGRVGNFLNQELVGKATEAPWGIYVAGILRHPSQLYEAFLEGIIVFIILLFYRKKQRFTGELIAMYGLLYSLARFIAEFWREPDYQIGYLFKEWISMGQFLSFFVAISSILLYFYLYKKSQNEHKRV